MMKISNPQAAPLRHIRIGSEEERMNEMSNAAEPGAEEFPYILHEGSGPQTLVLLHGTGGDEHDLLPLAQALAPDRRYLSPRGRVKEGSMNRWFARLRPGILDFDDVRRRAGELRDFLLRQAESRGLDPAGLWALGFSNGANIAAAMLLLYPDLFAGALLLRPMLPLDRVEGIPDLSGRKIFLAAGSFDQMIPRESTEELISLLRESRADLTVNWADAGHGFGPEELSMVKPWLEAALG
jgi:phospholipase/carboxylesterase